MTDTNASFPEPTRIEPDLQADERTTLIEFLDYYRASLALKAHGLTDAQAATASCPPSILTLTGLVRHMAEVERGWFQRTLTGGDVPPIWYSEERPDGDLDLVDEHTSLAESVAQWRAEIAIADEITAASSLERLSVIDKWGREVTLRWILVHMIEEYARHCGHADLLRERIDGAVGD
jgi:uncharacterized damage-inducible protein DinB